MKFDCIIIGSGIAGIWSARFLRDFGKKVLIITKREVFDCNSFYAQGGITLALDSDDISSHIEDTLKAGAYYNNKEAVELLSKYSLEVKKDLQDYGIKFDEGITKEGAHSKSRVYHLGGDATGRYLHLHLLKKDKNYLLTNSIVYDLLIDEDVVYGVRVLKDNHVFNLYANSVIVASGGIGALYKYDTNARTISADMHGVAVLKGIKLKDMEMTQFHPTVFIEAKTSQKLLLTEALRGEGAKVVDENGKRFLFEYDNRGELASRDIVSRAIFLHQQKGHKVYLDVSNFTKDYFKKRFPTIYKKLSDYGLNLPEDKIPISPAFHYMMGGIEVDLDSKVKNFKNLYAVGEVANSGVHGANRLASNSLLECFVFAKRAAEDILKNDFRFEKKFDIKNEVFFKKDDKKYKDQLREIMWNKVGIIRTKGGLNEALEFITQNEKNVGYLTKLRFLSAKEIIKSALNREESLGAHYIKKE